MARIARDASAQAEGKWVVAVLNWHPTRLNRLVGSHWAKASRLKRFDAQVIACSVLGARVPRAKFKRRVSLEITLTKGQRAGDPDAYWKSVLDGLVACEALVNDSHVWCSLGEVTFVRGEVPKTVILLENMRAMKSKETTDETVASKKSHKVNL